LGADPASPGHADETPGRRRCLVVDDDTHVREMVSDILASGKYEVVMAVDGADGIAKFEARPFDVVVTDLAMPRLNGLQLARACKTLRPTVPILMLTGWGMLLTEDERSKHGVDEVLSKPVRVDELLAAVARAQVRPAAPEARR
jgi:CheY-like chemotaxis protein